MTKIVKKNTWVKTLPKSAPRKKQIAPDSTLLCKMAATSPSKSKSKNTPTNPVLSRIMQSHNVFLGIDDHYMYVRGQSENVRKVKENFASQGRVTIDFYFQLKIIRPNGRFGRYDYTYSFSP